jgi:hypothetical protein
MGHVMAALVTAGAKSPRAAMLDGDPPETMEQFPAKLQFAATSMAVGVTSEVTKMFAAQPSRVELFSHASMVPKDTRFTKSTN